MEVVSALQLELWLHPAYSTTLQRQIKWSYHRSLTVEPKVWICVATWRIINSICRTYLRSQHQHWAEIRPPIRPLLTCSCKTCLLYWMREPALLTRWCPPSLLTSTRAEVLASASTAWAMVSHHPPCPLQTSSIPASGPIIFPRWLEEITVASRRG